jgi:DNA modification methylase
LPSYGGIRLPLAIGAVVLGVPCTLQTPLSGQISPVLAVLPTAILLFLAILSNESEDCLSRAFCPFQYLFRDTVAFSTKYLHKYFHKVISERTFAVMHLQHIHPFPARMAPEIAFETIKGLNKNSIVLDPMMGSGTSLRIANSNGLNTLGADVDPMALLIAEASNSIVNVGQLQKKMHNLLNAAKDIDGQYPSWVDDETKKFINFWFAKKQRLSLTKIAEVISQEKNKKVATLFKVALSRCIITKDKGASLARDVSHAKPHKVRETNDYDVFVGFKQSIEIIVKRLGSFDLQGKFQAFSDDARSLDSISMKSIDSIITSPPYLHAVDYFRGHRLSLVWLGYTIDQLKNFRSNSIGIQKNPDEIADQAFLNLLLRDVGAASQLPTNKIQFLNRYAVDIYMMCSEFQRVLRKNRKATVVIADAYSSGVFIRNTQLLKNAARLAGLELLSERERQIPANKRYLPPPEYLTKSSLDKRMKTESVITFLKS